MLYIKIYYAFSGVYQIPPRKFSAFKEVLGKSNPNCMSLRNLGPTCEYQFEGVWRVSESCLDCGWTMSGGYLEDSVTPILFNIKFCKPNTFFYSNLFNTKMLDQQINYLIKRSKVRSTDKKLDQQIKSWINRSNFRPLNQMLDQQFKC